MQQHEDPDQTHFNRRHISLTTALIGGLILILLTAGGTYAVLSYGDPVSPNRFQGTAEQLVQSEYFDQLVQVVALAQDYHVSEPGMDTLLKGAIQGALDATGDRYALYYDTSAYEDFMIDSSGEYEGIGISVQERKESGPQGRETAYVTVISVFAGSPAETTPYQGASDDAPVGLRPGDRIVAVDGKSVVDTPLEVAADLMRGEEGTTVTVTVERPGTEGTLVFALERSRIEVPTVQHRVLNTGQNQVGYLQITRFNEQTPVQLNEALASFKRQNAAGIVIDLRYNPGGQLSSVEAVADEFISGGTLVTIKSRAGGLSERTVERGGAAIDIPLTVVVNEYTASAAEILAGAIQDHGRGTVVGETTFGKGSVQRVWPLDNQSVGVKMTTAKYQTPSGRKVDGQGIEPDIEVKQSEEVRLGVVGSDPQLDRALEQLGQQLEP